MQCKTVKEYLPFYFYNELDKKTISGIKSHIKNCKDCRIELEYFRKTLKLADREKQVNLPWIYRRILLNKILQATDLKEEREILYKKRAFVLSSGLAITLILFFSFIGIFKNPNSNMQWQNDFFTYETEELSQRMVNMDKATSKEDIQVSSYSLDEKIESILVQIEELMVFYDMKGGEKI